MPKRKLFIENGYQFHHLLYTGISKRVEKTWTKSTHPGYHYLWQCFCDCGNECWVSFCKSTVSKSCQKCSHTEPRFKSKYFPSVFICRILTHRKRRTKIIDFDLTVNDLDNLWESQNGKCYYTGLDLILPTNRSYKEPLKNDGKDYTCSLDRLNSNLGYTLDNVVLCHKMINFMKQAYSSEEFIQMCKLVAIHHKSHNVDLQS